MAHRVASSNGNGYSLFLQKEQEWRVFKDQKVSEYRVPPNYTPHHLKVLKTGCKLFIGAYMPGFVENPRELIDAVFAAIKK